MAGSRTAVRRLAGGQARRGMRTCVAVATPGSRRWPPSPSSRRPPTARRWHPSRRPAERARGTRRPRARRQAAPRLGVSVARATAKRGVAGDVAGGRRGAGRSDGWATCLRGRRPSLSGGTGLAASDSPCTPSPTSRARPRTRSCTRWYATTWRSSSPRPPARMAAAASPASSRARLRDFLGCGVLGRGFARVRCGTCAFERLVPFSCCPQRETIRSSFLPASHRRAPARDPLRIASCPRARR